MDDGGDSGWVQEGDKAPSFELPDTSFKAVNPLSGKKSKVKTRWKLGIKKRLWINHKTQAQTCSWV